MTLLLRYFTGLCATFAGAWGTELTDSMLPLALGAAVTLMCTVPLIRTFWNGRRP